MVNQDLHIHTVFSAGDSAVVAEQTLELISKVNHARFIGISDHFESITSENFEMYRKAVASFGFKVGSEVDGARSVEEAASLNFDYYIYHCRDHADEYAAIEKLLMTDKPVIIAHPYAFDTKLDRIPSECYIEINNRYIWRFDWRNYLSDYLDDFRFILSSDAHQPNWLNQSVAQYVAKELGIKESMVFDRELALMEIAMH
jgi:histidinol phosphatase-like PHP family hydrolase